MTTEIAKVSAPLAVVSHSLVGSLDEKVRAFEQMAAAMAQIQLNGWDTVQKCKAAFWLADGIGEHPATFVQSHYVMMVKGRLTVEPKWEFMIRKLAETVPDFRFTVDLETDDAARVTMTDGVNTHTVEYTLEDARRQGLLSGPGGNAWTTGSTREMCFKQAVKRCARRIGVGRAIPWVETEIAAEPAAAKSSASVVDEVVTPDEVNEQMGKVAKAVNEPAQPDPIAALSAALIATYGKQNKSVALQKATLLYNEMVQAETGENPGTVFRTVSDIGPVDAARIVAFIEARKAKPAPEPEAAPPADEPPAAEEEAPEPEAEPAAEDDGSYYETFVATVKRARKVFGRKFLAEAPAGSKKFWFLDAPTFSQAGLSASVKIMDENGNVVADRALIQQLTKIMATDCDAAERNGR